MVGRPVIVPGGTYDWFFYMLGSSWIPSLKNESVESSDKKQNLKHKN